MRLRYTYYTAAGALAGTYLHDDCEVRLSISEQARLGDDGIIYMRDVRWVIEGMLHGTDQAGLHAKLASLLAAYSVHGGDIVLLDNNNNPSHHELISTDRSGLAIGGVKIIEPPSFPQGGGAEYTTWRRYTIVIGAEIDVLRNTQDAGYIVLNESFTRTGSTSGPGTNPSDVYIHQLAGPPILQRVRTHTAFTGSQNGNSVGRSGFLVPSPIYPNLLIYPLTQITQGDPRDIGDRTDLNHKREFPASWSYQYHSDIPF